MYIQGFVEKTYQVYSHGIQRLFSTLYSTKYAKNVFNLFFIHVLVIMFIQQSKQINATYYMYDEVNKEINLYSKYHSKTK